MDLCRLTGSQIRHLDQAYIEFPNVIFMNLTLLQISKPAIFPQKIQHLPHSFYVTPALIFSIEKDVIQIYHDKDIELF